MTCFEGSYYVFRQMKSVWWLTTDVSAGFKSLAVWFTDTNAKKLDNLENNLGE